ncbi:MAG: hypothetical protein HFI93_11655 [Lachnospiraceae bacterium]|nr:hypothetical protein [Lachnospiraceae bacterium]
MKKKRGMVITVVIVAVLAVSLLLLSRIRDLADRTEDVGAGETQGVQETQGGAETETQVDFGTLAGNEESWAQEREREQSLAEEKQAEQPTVSEGSFWIVLNPEAFFSLNEEVSGWRGGITWKVTDVSIVDSLPDYPSAKYTQANDLFFLNEEGGLAVERINYIRNDIAGDGGLLGQEPAEAELAILLVELEVSSDLSYEFDFEYPLEAIWFEEKEGQTCCTFVNGMFQEEGIGLYGPWGEGMPFYISAADRNGSEGDPSHFLFYKLQPGETLCYQAAFLVDRNTLGNTWLSRVQSMDDYLYYDVKPCFLPVGQLLAAEGGTE